jgi:zinc transport system substrate-binding protein
MKKIFVACLLFCCFFSPVLASDSPAPQVLVSIKPLHSLVAGVMQGVGQPLLLVKGGGSPHGYVLRPSEAQALAKAQLVVWVGHTLESFLEKPLATLAPQAQQLELAEILEDQLLPLREGGSWDVHAHGHEHADHAAEAEEHHHGEHELNPHLWLSPLLAKQIVAQVATALSNIDPPHQATYRQNAEQLQLRLDELNRQLTNKLAPVKGIPYIVFHDAYQYFESDYGLNAVGSVTIDPERKPGAKRIQEIRDKIKSTHARCVFSEPQFEPRMVETIIEGTGAKRGTLDPLGADLPEGPDAYFLLLSHLADNLYAGLK